MDSCCEYRVLLKGTLIRDNWEVKHQLGEGGCGVIYMVIHTTTQEKAALKVEPIMQRREDEILKMEARVMNKLKVSPWNLS